MLRPQGLFQNQQPRPVDWQPNYPPAPGGYQQGAGQYPPGYQQPGSPQPWPQAPAGALPPAGYQPGGQYPPGAAPANGGYQGSYQNGQYGGQYGQGQYGQGQFPPGVQYGPDGMPLGGGSGPQRGRLPLRGAKGPVVLLAGAGAVVVVVVAALMLSNHGTSSSNAGSSTSASGSPTGTSAASATAKTQHQAAIALSGLLSQSGGDRADVIAAYASVSTCGKDLAKDAATFNKAAANRRILLAKLAKLPGRSALSTEMLTDLTNAWQASATVDADLAKWATDESGHCSKKKVLKDKNYTATLPFDSQATNNKNAFVELWNPLAKKNGLAKIQPSQL